MNVPKGLSTYIGFIAGGGLLVILPLLAELADALKPFGVPVQTWVYIGAGIMAVTIIGRMWQAASAVKGAAVVSVQPNVEIDGLPVNAHEGAVR